MSEPRPEAAAAARWWTDTITGRFVHDVSARRGNASYGRAQLPPARAAWTDEQRDAFRDALAGCIEQLCAKSRWRPEDPAFDSHKRMIWCDNRLDELLVNAARAAGLVLRPGDVPKRWMHIYPGTVFTERRMTIIDTGEEVDTVSANGVLFAAIIPLRSGSYVAHRVRGKTVGGLIAQSRTRFGVFTLATEYATANGIGR